VSATGRECELPPATPWDSGPRCVDLTRARSYTEEYHYDPVGNLRTLHHRTGPDGFVRKQATVPDGNRLDTVTIDGATFDYDHDQGGNLTRESASRHLEWDHADRLRTFRIQAGAGPPSVYAQHLYDTAGQRLMKVVRKQGLVEVSVLVDGTFEHRLVRSGPSPAAESTTLHLRDGTAPVAAVRFGPALPDDATPPVTYLLADHLGSVNVILDAAGVVLDREEFTPYGQTSFGGQARRRWRYAGMDTDQESGLARQGVRCYAPWLARWTSCDPAGPVDGPNLYAFVGSNPMTRVDRTGQAGEDAPELSGGVPATGTEPPPMVFFQDPVAGFVERPAQPPPGTRPAPRRRLLAALNRRRAGRQAGHAHRPQARPAEGIYPRDRD
jgi:RHS repeat-associated protein